MAREHPTLAQQRQLWGEKSRFRLFLSHKSTVKGETGALAAELEPYHIKAFVAHEEIVPNADWAIEIERALQTMDALAALLTPDFHEGDWTHQEVGCAIGRDVPVVPIGLGANPRGIIARRQALHTRWEGAASAIMSILINESTYFDHYIAALRAVEQWAGANSLWEPLESHRDLPLSDARKLVAVYNECGEVRGGFAFNGTRPDKYGTGLNALLNKHHPGKFSESDWRITESK